MPAWLVAVINAGASGAKLPFATELSGSLRWPHHLPALMQTFTALPWGREMSRPIGSERLRFPRTLVYSYRSSSQC
jgi:hypothetical protein